jgi:hypothetical protein
MVDDRPTARRNSSAGWSASGLISAQQVVAEELVQGGRKSAMPA